MPSAHVPSAGAQPARASQALPGAAAYGDGRAQDQGGAVSADRRRLRRHARGDGSAPSRRRRPAARVRARRRARRVCRRAAVMRARRAATGCGLSVGARGWGHGPTAPWLPLGGREREVCGVRGVRGAGGGAGAPRLAGTPPRPRRPARRVYSVRGGQQPTANVGGVDRPMRPSRSRGWCSRGAYQTGRGWGRRTEAPTTIGVHDGCVCAAPPAHVLVPTTENLLFGIWRGRWRPRRCVCGVRRESPFCGCWGVLYGGRHTVLARTVCRDVLYVGARFGTCFACPP
eukprot:3512138-Prymnesium_polylepis.1